MVSSPAFHHVITTKPINLSSDTSKVSPPGITLSTVYAGSGRHDDFLHRLLIIRKTVLCVVSIRIEVLRTVKIC